MSSCDQTPPARDWPVKLIGGVLLVFGISVMASRPSCLAQSPPIVVSPTTRGTGTAPFRVSVLDVKSAEGEVRRVIVNGLRNAGMRINAGLQFRGPDAHSLNVALNIEERAGKSGGQPATWQVQVAADVDTAKFCEIDIYIYREGDAHDAGEFYKIPLGRWVSEGH